MRTAHFEIPQNIMTALDALEKKGFEAYLVGGCVRDRLMGIEPSDYDIATSARPEDTLRVFSDRPVIKTGLKHGTVTVVIDHENIEITTYRIDGEYDDNRRPSSVTFTDSLTEDLARRDFRCNAIAYSPFGGIRDPFCGRRDIEAGVIACVGDPDKRFSEDGLRILRALRFSSRLGFAIDSATRDSIHKNKELLQNISSERILSEFKKLLCGKNAEKVLIEYPDVIGVFIPEILPSIGFDQKNPHHIYDVYGHTVKATVSAPDEPVLRLAAFLHDIAKPGCFTMGDDGVGHFYGHAEASADMAGSILKRLKCDNETIRLVTLLIHFHMDSRPPEMKSMKRLLGKMSIEEARMLIALRYADVAALEPVYASDTSHIDEKLRLLDEIEKSGDCVNVSALDINGFDLIKLGIKPGPQYRRILDALLERVISGELPNEKASLTDAARNIAGI